MKLVSLEKIKNTLTEENLHRIYGEKISLEEVIEKKIKPYRFSATKIEKYKESYYLAVYQFINNVKYSTTRILFERFSQGIDDDGFKEWFIKEVHSDVFAETVEI